MDPDVDPGVDPGLDPGVDPGVDPLGWDATALVVTHVVLALCTGAAVGAPSGGATSAVGTSRWAPPCGDRGSPCVGTASTRVVHVVAGARSEARRDIAWKVPAAQGPGQ